jgi:hypothetical protein
MQNADVRGRRLGYQVAREVTASQAKFGAGGQQGEYAEDVCIVAMIKGASTERREGKGYLCRDVIAVESQIC